MKEIKEVCPICNKCRKLETHRRLCQYHEDSLNWFTCCKQCKKDDDEHWKQEWKDYYQSQGFGGFWYE